MSRAENVGAQTSTSNGTLVPGHTINTKGSYTQLVAATSYDAHMVLLSALCDQVSYTTTNLVDIAIGAAGAEQVIIPDVMVCSDQWDAYNGANLLLPVAIPAGSRIAARCQGSNVNQGVRVKLTLFNLGFGGPLLPGRKVVSYGTVAASSRGTSIDPGASANTKGSYAQIAASVAEDIKGFYLLFGNGGSSKGSTGQALVDLAIGGAGAEQIILPDFPIGLDPNSEIWSPTVSPFIPMPIPAGQRVAARSQCSITTAGDRTVDLAIVGVA